MYSITVRNNILIAHSLPGEVFGPAQNMHGATYIVDAEFYAKEINKYNIIMDPVSYTHLTLPTKA